MKNRLIQGWNKLTYFFGQPFPDEDSIPSIFKSALISGLIVFLVLFVFKPFGIQNAGEETIIYIIGFGMVTSFVVAIIDLIVKFIFKIDRQKPSWTYGKWLMLATFIIFNIAGANFLFMRLTIWDGYSIDRLWAILLGTVSVGIIPLGVVGMSRLISDLQKYKREAQKISISKSTRQDDIDVSKNVPNKNIHHLSLSSILYIEAMQNYIKIVYLKNDQLLTELKRESMISAETSFEAPFLIRCHRSYIVNIKKVLKVSGNAQGLQLVINFDPKLSVPVSRKFVQQLKVALEQ